MPTSLEITDDGFYFAKWTGLSETAATGAAARVPYPHRCIEVRGDFGAGGGVTIQGSNDAVSWHTLTDLSGATLVLTAAGLKQIRETCIYVRPVVTAGTAVGVTAILSALTRG